MPSTIKPVKFNIGDDAHNWLKLYDSASLFNEWTERQKLSYVGNCFPPEYQEWALNLATSDSMSWNTFSSSFLAKFIKKTSPMQLLSLLNSLKMSKQESAVDYIDRFTKLKTSYDRESLRRNSQVAIRSASIATVSSTTRFPTSVESSPNTQSSPNVSDQDTPHQQKISETEEIIIAPEGAYIKYFIHGIRYEFVRVSLKNYHFNFLEDLFESFKLTMDDYEDEIDFATTNTTDTKTKAQKNETDNRNYDTLAKNVKELTTTSVAAVVKMMQDNNIQGASYPKTDYLPCGNCDKKGHATRLCRAPC